MDDNCVWNFFNYMIPTGSMNHPETGVTMHLHVVILTISSYCIDVHACNLVPMVLVLPENDLCPDSRTEVE